MALLWLVSFPCWGCASRKTEPKPTPVAVASVSAPAALRPQPKPGERVRQPELDSYCGEPCRTLAFYYHGGRPVSQLAHKDGCSPLYITECENDARCYPPRDQEPGMWCCSAPTRDLPAHAER